MGLRIRYPRWLRTAGLVLLAGCTSPTTDKSPTALSPEEQQRFFSRARDARIYGITIYRETHGARFEGAQRLHWGQSAQLPLRQFSSRRPLPVITAQSAAKSDFQMLLDSSSCQNWLAFGSVAAMGYRPFSPPLQEWPDHVGTSFAGAAGTANKLLLDRLHVEYPVFFVPLNAGHLGALTRATAKTPSQRCSAVMGASLMRSFSYLRFDFPARSIQFAADQPFPAPAGPTLRAVVPMRNWRGRPALEARLNQQPLLVVVDTAGNFELSLPAAPDSPATLALGDWEVGEIHPTTHAAEGLPDDFPARLGLGILSRGIVTLDFCNQRIWFEEKPRTGRRSAARRPSPSS